MSLNIVFSIEAINTFDAIRSQIRQKWGSDSVVKFESKVRKTLDLVSKSPFIFQSVEELEEVRKGIISRQCSFFYQVKETQIEVLFFWDNRQEPLNR